MPVLAEDGWDGDLGEAKAPGLCEAEIATSSANSLLVTALSTPALYGKLTAQGGAGGRERKLWPGSVPRSPVSRATLGRPCRDLSGRPPVEASIIDCGCFL